MGLIDLMVDRSFRETGRGRVVVFSGDPRKRAYLVNSTVEEKKIRSFLQMFYFAHVSVMLFGIMLGQSWATGLAEQILERPARHFLASLSISLAVYAIVLGIPYFFLWRAYRRALLCFGAVEDEVTLAETTAPRRQWVALAVAGFSLLILGAVLLLVMRPVGR
jgi:hypothetical protein